MFAICVVPIIGVIGLSIDLTYITISKTSLSSAADAAALAAVKAAADAFTAGKPDPVTLGHAAGLQWFYSQAATMGGSTLATPTVTVDQSGAVFSATVSYQGSVPAMFGRLFGVSTMLIGGTSSATITSGAYMSITFLLDNSSSMLAPATQADADLMNAITPSQDKILSVPNGLGGIPCAFACHWDPEGHDYYGLARRNKVVLGFDVLQLAVQTALAELIREEVIPGQFNVAIYTFENVLAPVYLSDPDRFGSKSLSDGMTAAKVVQTPVVSYAANSDFPRVLASLSERSAAAGDGSSPASPRKALILVTDGLADYGTRTAPGRRGPIDPTNCAAIKSLGFSVWVLYTDPVTSSPVAVSKDPPHALPYVNGSTKSAIVAALRSCASLPTNLAPASDPSEIRMVMKQILQVSGGAGARITD